MIDRPHGSSDYNTKNSVNLTKGHRVMMGDQNFNLEPATFKKQQRSSDADKCVS